MRLLVPMVLGMVCSLAGGCASTPPGEVALLSGKAPMADVVDRADTAARGGDYRAAAVLYRQALEQEASADVWYRLGMSLMRLGESKSAMAAFHSALQLEPDHAPSLERVALHLTSRGRADEAQPYLEHLLQVQPDSWKAQNALAVAADLEGHFDTAAEHYAAAIELQPGSAMLWNNLGFSRYLAGDYAAARKDMAHALELDPAYGMARHNVALVLAREGRYDEAVQLMAVDRTDARAYSDVGYLAFQMGDYDAAEALLGQAIRRSGTYDVEAHRQLAAVRRARIHGPTLDDLKANFSDALEKFFGAP